MSEAPINTEVVIAGGGMAGLTLGLALSQAGVDVVVADTEIPATQLAPTYDGRACAIAYASFRMWEALGLGPTLQPHAQRIEKILVTDGRARTGPSLLSLAFDRRELDARPDGEALGYMLENRWTRVALNEAAARADLRLIAPAAVVAHKADAGGVTVTLKDGRAVRASLLVSAEGRRSTIRSQEGIRTAGWKYNQTAVVCTVAHEKPHEGVAHEYFLPSGPFAMLPLTDNRMNIVWTETPAISDALMKLSEADFLSELRARFGDHLGAISMAGPRFAYPLSLQLAEKFVAPRTALIGDAAHGVHPIAGQGLNVGLRDVAALAECIVDATRVGLEPGDAQVLSRYQTWRRFDSTSMALVMDGFNKVFSNDFGPLRQWRGRGMALIDAIPPARKFFMREAAGGSGDMPKLLKGEALGV
ncbi:MAG: 2-octaprenyl-6-methoxyphenol hydroxylase [Alphaproteobacteria bacterium]|nr:MAG: 2-octaprenyl-6-methoxyphenol hydroxylase [Caulobacteraceae bacterium]TPW03638.1 MAG: 2-octaprenyl-6-methoxyphenol hydroxylase [Alphaproteobacteria bacterium]